MSRFKNFLLLLLIAIVPTLPASANSIASGQHYDARLVLRSLSAAPGGSLDVAVVIEPAPGWHIYWSNPGESGYAPTMTWTSPAGMDVGQIRHPAPRQLILGGIASNVHEGETILLQRLHFPEAQPTADSFHFATVMDMLLCSDSSCVPDPLHFEFSLPVGSGAPDPAVALFFSGAEANLPIALEAESRFQVEHGQIRIFMPGIELEDGETAHFFGAENGGVSDSAEQAFNAADGGLMAMLSAGKAGLGAQVSGVLRIDGQNSSDGADGSGSKSRSYQISAFAAAQMPAELPDTAVASNAAALDGSFFMVFGAAVLGGLLLNLMPCVFPILSLKALALVRAGGDDREAKQEALGYSLGAIGVIMLMGATLLMLRSGGQTLGWAFQLQDTRVVILLLLLMTAIASNLAGLYELPMLGGNGRAKSGFAGAVSTGALAAFIATPCTGPFMAGALGAALLLPIPAAMAIFFGLGLGLALPFLMIGFFKPVRRWLPKPGAWMLKLRQILSLPMFATALGLAWIVGRQAGVDVMAAAVASALLLAIGLWWYGLRQISAKPAWPVLVPVLAAVFLSVNLNTALPSAASDTIDANEFAAVPFSQARFAELRAANQPVFLYMTADWCLSCKVNEATSLSSSLVAAAFRAADITVMRGDWTRGDPQITAFLKAEGSAGVPLYLWYPAQGEKQQMPQVLTPSMLIEMAATSSPPMNRSATLAVAAKSY